MFGWETVSRKAVLPVDTIVPEIVSSLSRHPNLVIEAPPGAGKTTRVPPALFGFSHRIPEGEVVVVEPRRIAARLAARRVAWEMGEQLGGTVDYPGSRRWRARAHGFPSNISRTRLCR